MSKEGVIGQRLMDAYFRLSKLSRLRPIEGLRPPEMDLLHLLNKAGKADQAGLKVSELSQRMHVTPSMVTQVVKVLEARGLVSRTMDPDDRRVVRISITAEGKRKLAFTLAGIVASFESLAEHLGEERSAQLVDLLTEVNNYLLQNVISGSQSSPPTDELTDDSCCCPCHATHHMKTPDREDDVQP